MNNTKYIGEIDGLRAIAILFVIFFHLNQDFYSNGFLGVDIFFVISGFVITNSLHQDYKKNNKINILNFYIRRIIRLYPALVFTVLLTCILYFFFGYLIQSNLLVKSSISAIFAFSNIFYIIGGSDYFLQSVTNPLLHTWSLSLEEQFYFIYPFILSIILFINFKYNNSYYYILLIILITFLLSLYIFLQANDNILSNFYFPLSRFWELILGCLTYYIYNNKNYLKNNNFIFIISFLLILFLQYNTEIIKNLRVEIIIYTFLTVLIILSGGSIQRLFLGNKIIIYIGKLSYSLYLVHLPIIYFSELYLGNFTLNYYFYSLLFSFIFSFLSYHYIENFFRFRINLFSTIKKLILILPSLIFISVLILFFIGFNKIYLNFNNFLNSLEGTNLKLSNINYIEKNFSIQERTHALWEINGYITEESCKSYSKQFTLNELNLKIECLKYNNNQNLYYLIGDSHAEHFASMLDNSDIIQNLYFDFIPQCVVFQHDNCPKNEQKSFDINEKVKSINLLSEKFKNINLVVSFFIDNGANEYEKIYPNLFNFFDKLNKNINIILIAPTPYFPYPPIVCVTLNSYCSYSKKEIINKRYKFMKIYKNLENSFDNLTIIDFLNQICVNDECFIYDKKK